MSAVEGTEEQLAQLLRHLAARAEAGEPLPGGESLTPTAALSLANSLLEAVNVEVFELALWKSWGGVRTGKIDV